MVGLVSHHYIFFASNFIVENNIVYEIEYNGENNLLFQTIQQCSTQLCFTIRLLYFIP